MSGRSVSGSDTGRTGRSCPPWGSIVTPPSPRGRRRSRTFPRCQPGALQLLLIWLVEHEIAVEEHVERLALADRDRGWHLHPAAEDLERDVGQFLAEGARGDLARRRRGEEARLLRLAELDAGADRGQEERAVEGAAPVGVHLVLGTGLPLHVLEVEAGQAQAPAVREDKARPPDEQPVLPASDLVVVEADAPRA